MSGHVSLLQDAATEMTSNAHAGVPIFISISAVTALGKPPSDPSHRLISTGGPGFVIRIRHSCLARPATPVFGTKEIEISKSPFSVCCLIAEKRTRRFTPGILTVWGALDGVTAALVKPDEGS